MAEADGHGPDGDIEWGRMATLTPSLTSEERRRLEDAAYGIRRLSVEMITWGQWGHIGGSFSMAEILAILYFRVMTIDPAQLDAPARDRFILSKAHGSPGLYAALALRGYFPEDEI